MSLGRALTQLAQDDHTERVLRDVLSLFGHHEQQWLSEFDVQVKTGRTPEDIHAVLPVLSDAFVLDFDRAAGRYRYTRDVVLGFEIETFMRRVESHQSHMRTNVAKFRERHGY